MTERELFIAALHLPSPEARAEFLEKACAGDQPLRDRVESLLREHEQIGSFLESRAALLPDVTGAFIPDDRGTVDLPGGDSATGAFVPGGVGTVDLPSDTASTGTFGPGAHRPKSLATGEYGSDRVTGSLDDTSTPVGRTHCSGTSLGTVIAGRYTLVEVIGEGGMGSVYLASQTEPVKRQVALKLIKTGMDSKGVLARFDAERQALALMDHPNIARIYDGGVTPAGQPFFVMELVKGVPLTEYCDSKRLSVNARLELFVSVCQAVQHAHQKGIIHRDLKPGNVLVTEMDGRPMPKVIDFGVAKATGVQLTDQSFSDTGAIVGTPAYMSPEQADPSTQDIDTRTDVYALGVMLYELLTGSPPIDSKQFKRGAILEMLRMVREVEPLRPSTKLSTADALPSIAANRSIEPAKLAKLLQGELDWVVMKALEKDRTRRYETANGLARDIQRYLADEVVEARPPSRGYQVRKFVRRNRPHVVAAGLVLLALVAGLAGTGWQAVRAENARADEVLQRQRAEDRERDAEAAKAAALAAADAEKAARLQEAEERGYAQGITDFVQNDFLALTSVEGQVRFGGEGLDRNATLLDLLNRAAGKLKERKDLAPRIEAQLCWIVGVNYRGVGAATRGVPFLERAVELRTGLLGCDHADTLSARNSLGVAYSAAGRTNEAIALYEQLRNASFKTLGTDHPFTLTTLRNLAAEYRDTGRTKEAIALFEQVQEAQVRTLGPEHHDTLITLNNLAGAYRAAGRAKEAISLFEQVREALVKTLGADHPDTLITLNNLALAYESAGRTNEAIALFEQVREALVKTLGPDHPNTLTTLNNLAAAYRAIGRMAEAISLGERVLEAQVKTLGPDHPNTLTTLRDLALAYESARRRTEPIALFERSRQALEKTLGPDHPSTLTTLNNLAGAYRDAGRTKESIALYERVRDARVKTLGPDHHDTLTTFNDLALMYLFTRQTTEAIALFERVHEAREKTLGPDHPSTLTTLNNLAGGYGAAGRTKEAIALFEQILEALVKTRGPDHVSTLNTLHNLARAYESSGQTTEAITLYKRLFDGSMKRHGPDHPDTLYNLRNLAEAYQSVGRTKEAITLLEQVRDGSMKTLGPEHPSTLLALGNLGVKYKDAGRLADAIPLLEEAYRGSKKYPALRGNGGPLIDAYLKAGQTANAGKLVDELLADARKQLPKDSPQLAGLLAQQSLALLEGNAFAEAEPLLRECVAIREKTQPDAWTTFNTKSMLGGALLGQKKYADAEPLLLAGYEGLKQREKTIPLRGNTRIPEALDRLIEFYTTTKKPDEVKTLRAERAKYSPPIAPLPREKK